MLSRISSLWRRWVAVDSSRECVVEVGNRPPEACFPVIAVDFGAHASHEVAHAALTCVRPRRVLAIARFLADRQHAPAAWWVSGLDALPHSAQSAAAFVVELCHVGGRRVFVDATSLPYADAQRFCAHARRSAADLERRGLSPVIRVLLCCA